MNSIDSMIYILCNTECSESKLQSIYETLISSLQERSVQRIKLEHLYKRAYRRERFQGNF